MKSPKSKGSKKETLGKETVHQWYNRIDYWKIVQRTANLFWENRRRLITICILLLLTGGQALTFHSSSFSNSANWSGPGEPANFSNKGGGPDEEWQATLKKIENKEELENKIQEFFNNKEKLYGAIAFGSILLLTVTLILVILFLLNCHFHLLFLRTIQSLDKEEKKNKITIKKEVRGKWKQLAMMRLIFGLIYLATLILFFAPAGFFTWQRSWALAIAMAILAFFSIFIVFIILSYVFRYSLLYFASSDLSVKEAIDKGHDLFQQNWKESVLASLVNFALGIAAAITGFFIFVLMLLVLGLAGGFLWLIIWLVLGMAHPWGIAIGVGSVAGIIMILAGIIITAAWQGLVVIFWYYIFKELAGCKAIESCEEVIEEASVKTKKPAVKPVVQKEK